MMISFLISSRHYQTLRIVQINLNSWLFIGFINNDIKINTLEFSLLAIYKEIMRWWMIFS